MSTSPQIYDREYHQKIELEEQPQAERLASWIATHLLLGQKAKVTDFGCSTGIYVRAMRDHAIEAIGVENSEAAFENRVSDYVIQGDITCYCDIKWACDLGTCIEVAEHIQEDRAEDLIRCLVRHSRRWLIFSAAVPGQGGVGHVNCQDKPYWIEKFERRGWVVDYIETRHLLDCMARGYVMGWFLQNAMVLRPIKRG